MQRVATLVARGGPAQEVFAAVTGEVGAMLDCDFTPDEPLRPRPAWSRSSASGARAGGAPPVRVGERTPLRRPERRRTQVPETGRPARIDHLRPRRRRRAGRSSPRESVPSPGAPVTVEGRLWGVMMVLSRTERLPVGSESRLAGFTELVATAVANAEAQARADRVRGRGSSAAADNTRRRIERDLHDGAQQRLISLALQLRAVQAAVPPDARALAARLARLTDGADRRRGRAARVRPRHPPGDPRPGRAPSGARGAGPPVESRRWTSPCGSTAGCRSRSRSRRPPTTWCRRR